MKYTNEITEALLDDYLVKKLGVAEIAQNLGVPRRSVITKLSTLKVYVKPKYLNKQGNIPVKKSVYIERIGDLLDTELTESLEKVNKGLLEKIAFSLRPIRTIEEDHF